jgi:hypothetical protein
MNRFGSDSSGVYRAEDNEVHYRLEEEGTEPIPKPTKEEFRKWVLNRHSKKKSRLLYYIKLFIGILVPIVGIAVMYYYNRSE